MPEIRKLSQLPCSQKKIFGPNSPIFPNIGGAKEKIKAKKKQIRKSGKEKF